jgi:hypothetical protein
MRVFLNCDRAIHIVASADFTNALLPFFLASCGPEYHRAGSVETLYTTGRRDRRIVRCGLILKLGGWIMTAQSIKVLATALLIAAAPTIGFTSSANAAPIANDTLTIDGVGCPLVDDSSDGSSGETRCNFPANFNPPNKGRVSLIEADGSISDILWVHASHFHYISDPTLTAIDGHLGDFNTDLGSVLETAGNIDVSDKFGFAANSGRVVITSDVDDRAPDPVPEPGTLGLLFVGLAGLGYRSIRRKQ